MKLFQYWDTGEPPDDVAECVQGVRDLNPQFAHRLFDRNTAVRFIDKHVGRRESDAFAALIMPAMQADYLRLCALWAKGGLWLDADMRCIRGFRSLLADAPDGYVSMLSNLLETDILFVRAPQSPFFRACLELATRHIEKRLDGQAYDVTGPRVLNLIWAAVDPAGAAEDSHLARDPSFLATPEAEAVAKLYPGAGEAFALMTRRHNIWSDLWAEVLHAAYKTGPTDWRRWRGPIYRTQPISGSA